MKRLCFMLVVCTLSIMGCARSDAATSPCPSSFILDHDYAKLGLSLRYQWQGCVADVSLASTSLSVMVKVKSLTPSIQHRIEKAGLHIQTVIGSVITGEASLESLMPIAKLSSVIAIEGANVVHTK